MPLTIRQRHQVPTTLSMAGVPASKHHGAGFKVTLSFNIDAIIEPPHCTGTRLAMMLGLTHKTPTPLGPPTLCPLKLSSRPQVAAHQDACAELIVQRRA
jgi:hypothetical protein